MQEKKITLKVNCIDHKRTYSYNLILPKFYNFHRLTLVNVWLIADVESSILEPALRGTTNLLQSCSKVGSVRRVIFTSSISTITAKDENGEWIQEVNESCLNPANLVWKEKPSGWVSSLTANLFLVIVG